MRSEVEYAISHLIWNGWHLPAKVQIESDLMGWKRLQFFNSVMGTGFNQT